MGVFQRAKQRLGYAMGEVPQTTPLPAEVIHGETTTLANEPLSIDNMGVDDIVRGSIATVGRLNTNPPTHKRVLGFLKQTWRIIGPIAFVIFTAWEVYYYLNHFMSSDNSITTQVLLWGVTLLIEIPFMMATFDLSERKENAAEAKARGETHQESDRSGAIALWFVMAIVNITGQVSFLVFVTKVGNITGPAATGIYFFIVVRVLGVILGDAYAAFFFTPPPTSADKMVEGIQAKQKGIKIVSEATMALKRQQSDLKLELQRNENIMKREQSDQDFLTQMNEKNKDQMLRQQDRFFSIQEEHERKMLRAPETNDL